MSTEYKMIVPTVKTVRKVRFAEIEKKNRLLEEAEVEPINKEDIPDLIERTV